jgi:uncharacterized protein (UPF0548 family)
MVAPCRIVDVAETDTSFAFAYGTLPGHPESGEELFEVTRDVAAGEFGVRLRIVAVSTPHELLVRAVRPLARRIQEKVTADYLAALVAVARGPAFG